MWSRLERVSLSAVHACPTLTASNAGKLKGVKIFAADRGYHFPSHDTSELVSEFLLVCTIRPLSESWITVVGAYREPWKGSRVRRCPVDDNNSVDRTNTEVAGPSSADSHGEPGTESPKRQIVSNIYRRQLGKQPNHLFSL